MKIHHPKKYTRFTTTYIISGGFLAVIIAGAILLHLQISSATNTAVSFADSLFVATSSVCVTGLSTIPTHSSWSFFGQLIIVFLMQIGGLGIITFTTIFLQLMKKRIGLRELQLIRDAYNLDTDRGMDVLVAKVFKLALTIEAIGALLYCFVFVPEFGLIGIWKSIFNAVSAFCNAGLDVLGDDSLIPYKDNVLVNLVTDSLIVLGGIGFPIIILMLERIQEFKKKKPLRQIFRLSLYEKTVLFMTFILIFIGAFLIFIMEYENDSTIGDLPLYQKILASIFQSITTRTAGFCTVPQENLRRCTMLISCFLMFIGGSPSGTAGGIKTTTFIILAKSLFSSLSERTNTEIFSRKIAAQNVRRAMSVFMLNFIVMLISLTLFCIVQPGNFEDCLYEVVSAIGTVGLSRAFTPGLLLPGKLIIIATMYLGRIGPISLALFFNTKKYVNLIDYPEENIPIG